MPIKMQNICFIDLMITLKLIVVIGEKFDILENLKILLVCKNREEMQAIFNRKNNLWC